MGNKFKETDTMPTGGQFVAVYEFAGKIWSDTFLWDGLLYKFNDEYDSFEEFPDENFKVLSERENIKFYTV